MHGGASLRFWCLAGDGGAKVYAVCAWSMGGEGRLVLVSFSVWRMSTQCWCAINRTGNRYGIVVPQRILLDAMVGEA